MDQAQDTPPSRRRRWLVVAFVVLVSMVAWWYFPRGDARFVGKWILEMPFGNSNLDLWEFQSNGLLKLSASGSAGPSVWMPYRIENAELIEGCASSVPGIVEDVIHWWGKTTGNHFDGFLTGESRWTFRFEGQDVLWLHPPFAQEPPRRMTRIAE